MNEEKHVKLGRFWHLNKEDKFIYEKRDSFPTIKLECNYTPGQLIEIGQIMDYFYMDGRKDGEICKTEEIKRVLLIGPINT